MVQVEVNEVFFNIKNGNLCRHAIDLINLINETVYLTNFLHSSIIYLEKN